MQHTARRPAIVPEDYIPDPGAKTRAVSRALAAIALSGVRNEDAVQITEQTWPGDSMAGLLTKAAVTPLSTSSTPLLQTLQASFFASIAPQSAAVKLFERALKLDFAGVYKYTVPTATTLPEPVFVGEGLPFPMAQGTLGNVEVGPVRKMMLGVGITNELEFVNPKSAAAIISRMLTQKAGTSLDAVVFDAVAADEVRVAGLLNGVSDLGATATMVGDIAKLGAAVADAGGDVETMLIIASPAQALALKLSAGPAFTNPVIACNALTAGTVLAISPENIGTGFSGTPEIETSKQSTAHFEDTTPLPISTVGTPNVVAAPVRSAWQQNLLFLKLRVKCAWGALSPGAVQMIASAVW
jgi:hypothetical protein